jgi:hypothetical protein
MTAPVRLRLARAKGFNLQECSRAVNGLEAVNVARGPGRKWGNPFRVLNKDGVATPAARVRSVELFRAHVAEARIEGEIARDLRGKNLACWCALDACCHADVLLEIANRPTCEAV